MRVPLAIFILCFWLFLPMFMIWTGEGGVSDIANIGEKVSALELFRDYIMQFTFPNVNFILARILNLFQVVTLLVAYLLIRG